MGRVRLPGVLALSWALLLGGCASSQNVMYDGPRRPPAEVATLRGFNLGGGYNYAVTQIRGVDGKKVAPDNMKPNTVEVLPGKHRFEIFMSTPSQFQTTTVDFEVEPGGSYEVRHAVEEAAMDQRQLVQHDAYLYDVRSGQRLITLDQWSPVQNLRQEPVKIILYY